jgi:hypothetical protein
MRERRGIKRMERSKQSERNEGLRGGNRGQEKAKRKQQIPNKINI